MSKQRMLPPVWIVGLVAAVVIGAALRFIWISDIEYKIDERAMVRSTREFVEHWKLPALGIPTSQGFRNPGMSLWIFYPAGLVLGTEPTSVARGVQCCSLAAILLMTGFAWRFCTGREREWWLWAAALISVNPIAVLYGRKIWSPCTLPLLMMLLVVGWRFRSRRWGAFLTGIVSMAAGQIHLGAFFFVAALVAWTIAFDRRSVSWWSLSLGFLVGAIPMVPWLSYMLTTSEALRSNAYAFHRLVEMRFWTDWITQPLGFGLRHSLGEDYRDFLSWPLIGSRPTYAVLILHAIAAAVGVWIGATAIAWWRHSSLGLVETLSGKENFTRFVTQAFFLGAGLLFTISGLRFYQHYLIAAYPLLQLWLVQLALPPNAEPPRLICGRRSLVGLSMANAGLTIAFLSYIHLHGGAIHGDYGKAFAVQISEKSRQTLPR